MPEGWESPIGGLAKGLASGFEGGMRMGLLMREQKRAEDAQTQQIQQQKIQNMLTGAKAYSELLSIKGLAPELKNKYMNNILGIYRDAAPLMGLDPTSFPEKMEWKDGDEAFAKELNTATTLALENKISMPDFNIAALGIAERYGKSREDVKGLIEATQKEKETQNLSQGIGITGLLGQMQKQPSEYNAGFTPEQITSRQGIIEAQEREKYIGGGDIGRDILKERMKGKVENITGQFMTDKGVTVGYSDKTGAIAYEKDAQGNIKQVPYNSQIHGQKKVEERDAYKDDAVMTRIVNSFNADPTIRKVEQMDEFANLIIDVAKSDNPIGHASLETLMARASGEVGNLSEADKKPFGGSRALTMKIQQYFSELYKGKKTPENLKFISDLADTFRNTGKYKKAILALERAKQYTKANKNAGWNEKDIFQMLAPDEDYDILSKSKSPQRRTTDKQGGKVMTFNPNTGAIE